MYKIKFGYDVNLGLPSDFASVLNLDAVSYFDIGKMIQDFEQKEIACMFIPAGTLPYLKEYELIAQALFGSEKTTELRTQFVTTKKISIHNIPQLTLGRVNKYCSTSYWAPLIYLMNFLPSKTNITFKDTNGFQDMLHKTATDKLDASMVWDIILQQNANDASIVRELFEKSDIPTSVIVSHEGFSAALTDQISLFNSNDSKAFFTGFQTPDREVINQFIAAMQFAGEHFNVAI